MSGDPVTLAATLAEQLPRADIVRLAEAASAGPGNVMALRSTASSSVVRRACDQVAACLHKWPGPYVAGALAGAAAAIVRFRAAQAVDVVWTGPESNITTSRLTAAVVASLIAEAERELLLVSYATYTEPTAAAALREAAQRGVDITILAERAADNPRYSAAGVPFPDLPARRLSWPADRRPPGAALHAKLIVIDAAVALVTSANMTNRAMETNLECGVLIRGGPAPAAVRDHIFDLFARGELRRI